MVSAVFHSPLSAASEGTAMKREAALSTTAGASGSKTLNQPAPETTTPVATVAPRAARDWRGLGMAVLPPLLGLGLLVGIWALVSISTASSIPSPWETWKQAVVLFSDPFYRNGPNDHGVGWNVLASLQRVAVGFGLAALVGIPAGFAIGRFEFLGRMFNPLISLLRPVSPLAWLPIGLLVFKGANPAAIWTIFICSIWP